MKSIAFFSTILAIAASPLSAQTPAQPAPTPDFAASIRSQYTQNKGYIIASAEKMPDNKFAWRPAGLEAELRTFGQVLAHIANENNMVCSRILGTPQPASLDDAKGVFTKAEAKKILADAFALCDPLYASLTNQSIEENVKITRVRNGVTTTREVPRGTSLVANVAHSNEQYGMIMVYFAINGMTPPSHERN